ncbi:MAG TPA: cupin domain-containing protein [Mucilaginibacter sp.]
MKIKTHQLIIIILAAMLPLSFIMGFIIRHQDNGYFIDHEKDVRIEQEGPHNGGGKTTAFLFFDKVKNAKMTFRKRILHPGSSIGYHLQKEQEIYYILNGDGELQMNGKTIAVTTGDAILTMPGSSHGLKPTGNHDLSVLIAYEN